MFEYTGMGEMEKFLLLLRQAMDKKDVSSEIISNKPLCPLNCGVIMIKESNL